MPYYLMLISSSIFSLCICLHRKAQEQQKKVVVAGCVPQAQPRMDYLKGLSIIGVCTVNVYSMRMHFDLYERNNLINVCVMDVFIQHILYVCVCPLVCLYLCLVVNL